MNFMNNTSIRNKLMFIFFIWAIIFVGFGFYMIMDLSELSKITRDMYDEPMQASNAAIDAHVDIIKIQRDIKDFILLSNTTDIDKQLEQINEIDNRVLNNLAIMKSSANDTEISRLGAETEELFLQWKQAREEIAKQLMNGNDKEAERLSIMKNSEFVKLMEDKLEHIYNKARDDAYGMVEEAGGIQDSQRSVLIIFMLILSIASFIIFLLVIRSITRPISALKSIMTQSSSTGDLVEADLKGRNELADMAEHYNMLIKKLKSLFWIKDGQNSLAAELSGNIPVEQLCQKAINHIARAVDAGNGVFYLYDEEAGSLELNAAFAFTKKDKLSSHYELGEGIIGQVALEKRPVILRNVRKHEVIITTGTVCEIPLNIFAFPLLYEGKLYGVLELSSFEPFDQLKQEFLKEAARIISINLYTAVQGQKIKDLLDTTEAARRQAQTAAEELKQANEVLEEQQALLQQQTEELQQTNEELEEQQQLLQQQSEELQSTNVYMEEQQQQMEEQARMLNIKNRELETSRQELLRRTDELEKANKYKTEFLANMSHELRTPLNSIILLSRLISENAGNEVSEDIIRKVTVIYKSGQELLRLINDILDLSKIEAGKVDLVEVSFKSSDLLEELKLMFAGMAEEKNIGLIMQDEIDNYMIGDRDKISQILRNFLSNALKFTDTGTVTLEVKKDGEQEATAVFSVKDSGIGIAEDQLTAIFEEFKQGDGSISRKYGGTGLGLSISKKLSNIMKGEIEVESEFGKGSTFTLRLPNAVTHAQNAEAMGEPPVTTPDDMGNSLYQEFVPLSGRTILIIEDNEPSVYFIKKVIKGMGFDVLAAATGREGLELAYKYKVDGILLDMVLPDMSGIDVLREIKSTAELREIPVHVISGGDRNAKTQKAGETDFNQKLPKEHELTELIANMLNFSQESTKNLLVIEDDEVQREAVIELIKSKDIKVAGADTEEKAKAELDKGIYDGVVLDLKLREGNGLDILKFIGERKIDIPVIIYTGSELTLEQEKDIRKYADRIIMKTANSDERLLDEVALFLHSVRDNDCKKHYIRSKMVEECSMSLEKKKIMIVDDDPRNIFVLASALENHGADILEAENGEIALRRLKEQKADLVLMDIMMPVMDGYEAIRAIRQDHELKDLPIIALTAKGLKGDKEKCIEAGADDYISKPIDYDVLISLVKAWIEK